MTEEQDYYSLSDMTNKVKGFFNYLKTKWLSLLFVAVIGGGLGIGYYYYQSSKYEGVTTFILQEKTSSLGSLSGLASSLGVDINSGGSGLFVGDNILDILQSRFIVKKVLLSDYTDNQNQKKTLIDLFLDFTKYKQAWKKNTTLKNITFPVNSKIEDLSLIQDSVIEIVYKAFTKSYISIDRTSKKSSIIKVDVTSKNNLFSKYMSERLVAEALTFYVTVKTSVSKKNVDKLERKSDSILMLLNEKSYAAANLKILDPNPANKTLLVPNELVSRDKQVLYTLYGEVVKNLEIARMTLAQETPVIQILDTPEFPLYNDLKGKKNCLIIGAIICLFLINSFFVIKYLIKS